MSTLFPAPSEELTMLQNAAQTWARKRAPVAALRRVAQDHPHTGFDRALYHEMTDMGWAGIAVPEHDGGYGLGHLAIGLVAMELGRNLVASPLLSSGVAVAGALALAGSTRQKESWLAPLVAGELHAALALEETARHDPAAIALMARAEGDGWVLDGTKLAVADACGAGLLLVAARTSGAPGDADGVTLFLCPADADGLVVESHGQLDSRGGANIRFEGFKLGRENILGRTGDGLPLLEQILDRTCAVLAAEMVGSATQAFETTLEYLRTRVQFDHPIGSFQALQHRAADLLGEIELAKSAALAALSAIDSGAPDTKRLVSLAKAMAGLAFRRAAREMVQMHGGIGMTEEHDAGLYLKRAHTADTLYGNAAWHRQRYARLTGL